MTLGSPAATLLGQLLLGVCAGVYLSASAVAMPEMFPACIRGTGVAIGFNIPNAVFGGCAPLIGTLLIAQTGHVPSPAFYLILLGLGALVTALLLRRTDLFDDGFEFETAEDEADVRSGPVRQS
jgi:MHS family proline/betaine transporter-like MFS transporter